MTHILLSYAFKTIIFVPTMFFLHHFTIAQEREEEIFEKEENHSRSFSNMGTEEMLKPFEILDLEKNQRKYLQDILEKHYTTLKKALGKNYLDYERNSSKTIRETWKKTEQSILKMLKKKQYSMFKKELRNIIKKDAPLIHDTESFN